MSTRRSNMKRDGTMQRAPFFVRSPSHRWGGYSLSGQERHCGFGTPKWTFRNGFAVKHRGGADVSIFSSNTGGFAGQVELAWRASPSDNGEYDSDPAGHVTQAETFG